MTSEGHAPGQLNGRKLDDVVKEANGYYDYLRKKDRDQTRLDVAVVANVVGFAAFIVLGFTSLALSGCLSPSTFTICVSGSSPSKVLFGYLLYAGVISLVAAVGAGVITYAFRLKRRSKFEELRGVLEKMKGGTASSEDGLHLMDALHQAALVVKKRKVDYAYEYGIAGFILVSIFVSNALAGVIAGALAYLYFRQKALREFEKEDKRYEDSKLALLQSL